MQMNVWRKDTWQQEHREPLTNSCEWNTEQIKIRDAKKGFFASFLI